jgi:hypothetical protein
MWVRKHGHVLIWLSIQLACCGDTVKVTIISYSVGAASLLVLHRALSIIRGVVICYHCNKHSLWTWIVCAFLLPSFFSPDPHGLNECLIDHDGISHSQNGFPPKRLPPTKAKDNRQQVDACEIHQSYPAAHCSEAAALCNSRIIE